MRFLVIAALLSACGDQAYRDYYGEPQIIGASADTVQVRSGFKVSPLPAAAAHCGEKSPELVNTEQTDRAGYYTVSYFRCR